MLTAQGQSACSFYARRGRVGLPGFTLMEAMMASMILFVVVMSVTSAITAGQQNAYEAQQRIAAALAADEMMGRLMTVAYSDQTTWNGHTEAVGAVTNAAGDALPAAYACIGRRVTVSTSLETVGSTGVRVRGHVIHVDTYNADNRALCSLTRFMPEPQS